MALRALSPEEFGRFAGRLDYPMFVVTTTDGTARAGCLVGFTTQASIDPPRMLVCLSDKNHTYRVARGADLLAVHSVGADQHDLAELFGSETGDRTDKFTDVAWHEGPGRVPVLEGCPSYLVGRILARWPLGDHVGFLLEPVAVSGDGADAEPVLTLEDVHDLEPGHEA